ncbi:hypothetical protein Afil01_35820 [Actinorhabdospora filicis]|uniref:Uncharacterized protein n=2 Tax=Actinorhabdospora filicis TaxID=1785913 RepID=A0A9W6SKP6_9ACTN|nr:hypothetical protein Afil01_35820 [Actinorhabdospora filicis]
MVVARFGNGYRVGMVSSAHSGLTVRPSARLVPWLRAWRTGLVPYDAVVDAVTEELGAGDIEHVVADLPGSWHPVPLGEASTLFARTHPDDIRLVLPVPGDPRGLPVKGPFTGAALTTGEAVIAGSSGLVPEITEHVSGSGDRWESVTWRVYPMGDIAAGHQPTPGEAEAELSEALHTATGRLVALDVARWRPELGVALSQLRRSEHGMDLPPGYDQRARRLYARAGVLERVLAIAETDAPGGAVNAHEAAERDAALRPLATACRQALMAACNARVG